MSQFLPESAGIQTTGSTSFTPGTPTTTKGDVALMQRVLQAAADSPNLIPPDFMAYIVDYIQTARLIIPIGQVFGYQKVAGIRGSVDSTGAVVSGEGFTASRSTTGSFDIAFTDAFASTPNVLAIVSDNTARFATVNGVDTDSATILTWDTDGAAHDVAFSFWAFSSNTL